MEHNESLCQLHQLESGYAELRAAPSETGAGVRDHEQLVDEFGHVLEHTEPVQGLDYPKHFGSEFGAIASGCVREWGQSPILADCIITLTQPMEALELLMAAVADEIEGASPAFALACCACSWLDGRRFPADESEWDELTGPQPRMTWFWSGGCSGRAP
jgi:hypothetical protein